MKTIFDKLDEMSRPPCEHCGSAMFLHASLADPHYSCTNMDCDHSLTILEGIRVMEDLNFTPAYDGSLKIDYEVQAAFETCKKPLSTSPPHLDKRCCLNCGARLVLRQGPRHKFFGCSRYPDCKGTRPFDPRISAEIGPSTKKDYLNNGRRQRNPKAKPLACKDHPDAGIKIDQITFEDGSRHKAAFCKKCEKMIRCVKK